MRKGRGSPPAPTALESVAAEPAIVEVEGPRIRIRGARTHNLADIDLDLPRDRLVVITGPSGSGKSSLAFDTLFAEGQRRYVESLSVGARQHLEQFRKPDVDLIEGLTPTVAISQHAAVRNPRATVGTVSEIHDYLRLLFARVGAVYSHETGERLGKHTIQDMVEEVLRLPMDMRLSILAPVVEGQPGDHRETLDGLRRGGFVRVAIDDEVRDLSDEIELDPAQRHRIEVYVDRLKIKPDIRGRVADSIELAAKLTGGIVKILTLDGAVLRFCERYADLEQGVVYPELTPALFSFNSPHGACVGCHGMGVVTRFDPRKMVPDPRRSIADGAVAPLSLRIAAPLRAQLDEVRSLGIDTTVPWAHLELAQQLAVLEGTGSATASTTTFEGVRPYLQRRLDELEQRAAEGEETSALEALRSYLIDEVCRDCDGQRLRVEATMVKLGDYNIHDLSTMPLSRLAEVIEGLSFDGEAAEIASVVLDQIRKRLRFLIEVGLGYLTLARSAVTLSGGESQRIRLATQVGAGLAGITYVLDEPSIGLHQRDNERLIAVLLRLRDLGNTLVVVEHDPDTMRAADWLVDLGPGAGVRGGRVVAAGPPPHVAADPASPTGSFLSGRSKIAVPSVRRTAKRSLRLSAASGHNLKDVSVAIPLGVLTCVTGVSGSGKSSLIVQTLLPEAARRLNRAHQFGLSHGAISGLEHLDKVIHVDQSPIGRTARSNPATYTGLFTELRQVFAHTPESRLRGYAANRFSFNVKGGRCEACQGEGIKRVEMQFLPDMFVECEVCRGTRYNRETLAITFRGKNIAEVLEMSVADACSFFAAHPGVRHKLEVLRDVGLGYLPLGQSAVTLSGGEAQRIKLAKELARKSTGQTLFILDEPTTGLHFVDVEQLVFVLQRLVDEGNTVVVIEHNLELIKCADHVIDMGPEGGDEGGHLVAAGSPEYIAKQGKGHTARFLRQVLSRNA